MSSKESDNGLLESDSCEGGGVHPFGFHLPASDWLGWPPPDETSSEVLPLFRKRIFTPLTVCFQG